MNQIINLTTNFAALSTNYSLLHNGQRCKKQTFLKVRVHQHIKNQLQEKVIVHVKD